MDKLEPKSIFVKDLLKKTKFKDRQHIYDLLYLEKVALKRSGSGLGGYMSVEMKSGAHLLEYAIILKELNPEKYLKFLLNRAKYDERFAKILKKEFPNDFAKLCEAVKKEWEIELAEKREANKAELDRWLKAGGKV